MVAIYYGAPGAGKSTFIAYLVQKERKKALKSALRHSLRKRPYKYIWCNVHDVLDTNFLNLKDLSVSALPPGSLALVDEAGIDLNSRKTLSMPQGMIEYFKLHRHYKGTDLYFFSQAWDDIDITVKRLATEIWHLKKLGPFTLARLIKKDSDIDSQTHQISDFFKKVPLLYRLFTPKSFKIIFRPLYYKYFTSYSVPDRPLLSGVPICR